MFHLALDLGVQQFTIFARGFQLCLAHTDTCLSFYVSNLTQILELIMKIPIVPIEKRVSTLLCWEVKGIRESLLKHHLKESYVPRFVCVGHVACHHS